MQYRILAEFEDAFVYELNQYSVLNGFVVHIETSNQGAISNELVHQRPDELNAIQNHVRQLLASGHLSHSNSFWSANPFLINNPAAGIQELGVNYHDLNNVTHTEPYRLPTCEEVLNSIGYSECFSLIVLKDAFKQLALDDLSKKKTAFTVPGKRLCVPSGLDSHSKRDHSDFD